MNYAATASRLAGTLGKFGLTITYTRTATPTVNGPSGTVTEGAATNYTPRAIILPASKGTVEAFDNRRESESLKGAQMRYLKIAAADLAIEPRPDDTVTFGGKSWRVLGCTPVDPSGACPLVYGVGVVAL